MCLRAVLSYNLLSSDSIVASYIKNRRNLLGNRKVKAAVLFSDNSKGVEKVRSAIRDARKDSIVAVS